jgi:hypothetical protein
VRDLVRNSPKFFGAVLLVGLGLRLVFFFLAPQITDDSRIYADIARNWLRHGVYGVTGSEGIIPTYIRLPGYPAFLAGVFAVFGDARFRAVLLLQILFDIGTCFLVADLTRRTAGARAAKAAFLLAALCPFLANYTAAVLTETLELFFTTAALDLASAAITSPPASARHKWLACGFAISACIYLRPDGGLLLPAIGGFLILRLFRAAFLSAKTSEEQHQPNSARPAEIPVAVCILTLASLLPLLPWTVRNLHTMHRFQPLAPRYANEPGEFVPVGFIRWVKTWIADYTSVEEVYWQEPGGTIDPNRLPSRAFDSPEQKARTLDLLRAYNETTEIEPELDREFNALAEERIRDNPLRYYAWLPTVRVADMWLRPRTELLPADPRWWEFNDDLKWIVASLAFGVLNLFYLVLAGLGIWRSKASPVSLMLVVFLIVRSVFLSTLENPEPRYTLECYSAVIVLASTTIARRLPVSTEF